MEPMWKMKLVLSFSILILVNIRKNDAESICGCKFVRPCYMEMVQALKYDDEEACIENAAVGASAMLILLNAMKKFCPDLINVIDEHVTYEGRHLYEVVLMTPAQKPNEDTRPVIVIEAGQTAGIEPVSLALYLIEQLLACTEYTELLQKARWVIMPCTNPDGMEYARFNRVLWKKNLRPSEDSLSTGVDISRNFETQWGSCDKIETGFAPIYPGLAPTSENETLFVKHVLTKYKDDIKTYLSLRRDGHAIMYPYAHTKSGPTGGANIIRVAGEISKRVNQRAGGIQSFVNDSIYGINGEPHCGHSVDYAFDLGIELAFEMRVFLGSDNRIMFKFQQPPKGYETSLRNGYFSGIRELYNIIINEKKQAGTGANKLFK